MKGDKTQTAMVHLDIKNKSITLSVTPYKIYKDQIVPQTDKEKQAVWQQLEEISYGNIKISNGKISY